MTAVHLKKTAEPWFRSIYDQVEFPQDVHTSDQKNGKKKDRSDVDMIKGKFASGFFSKSSSLNMSSYSNSSKSTQMTASQSYQNMESFHRTETTQFQLQDHQSHKKFIENPIFDLDETKPAFIQHFNKLNSVLPNYHHVNFSLQQQIQKLGKLLLAAQKAFKVVKSHAEKIIKKSRISDEVRNLGLKFVNKSDCETCKEERLFDELKPRSKFKIEVMSQEILQEKLMLVQSKITRYQIALSLTSKIQLNLYLRIREVLQQVEQQLINCSASIYTTELKQNQYPNFCYAYIELIKNDTVLQK